MMACNVEDFPAPFGPIRLVTLAGDAEKETPVAAFTP